MSWMSCWLLTRDPSLHSKSHPQHTGEGAEPQLQLTSRLEGAPELACRGVGWRQRGTYCEAPRVRVDTQRQRERFIENLSMSGRFYEDPPPSQGPGGDTIDANTPFLNSIFPWLILKQCTLP